MSDPTASALDTIPSAGHAVLLFDGVCLLCSRFVHFVIDRDPTARFQFVALQSETGQEILRRHSIPRDLSTVVLVDEAGAHTRSTAALRVLRHLGAPYQCLYGLVLIPRPLRDLGYKLVAASRYRLFGQDEYACRRMSKEMRRRFLAEKLAEVQA